MEQPAGMPDLGGLRVVVCRSADQSQPLVDAIRAAGGVPVEMPLIQIAPPLDGGASLVAALKRIEDFDWVSFTSANGVASANEVLPLERWPAHVKVAAVGGMTARAINAVGRTVDLRPESATAADLARAFDLAAAGEEASSVGDTNSPLRILAPLAELANGDLADGLTALGHRVKVVTAYRSIEPDVADSVISQAATADAVFLTAPSIARRYWQLVSEPQPRQISVAMGPRTMAGAEQLGYRNLTQAESADVLGLVKALATAAAQ